MKIYLVDRNIPKVALKNETDYLTSWKNTFEFIAGLTINNTKFTFL